MKVLLVDDHTLFSQSLAIALEDCQDIQSFKSVGDASALAASLRRERPDVLLMDIHLGRMAQTDGLSLCKSVLEQFPEQPVIILSGYNLPVYRREARRIGARGFVSKDVMPEELLAIMRRVVQGHAYFPRDAEVIEELTHAEKHILELTASGMKRKEIAAACYMSERTVSNHLQHIFAKLQVTSAVEAVAKAIQMGYIPPMV